MIKNGLYKASFKTPYGSGEGVIFLKDGFAYGGDSNFYYNAKYNIQNGMINAVFELKQHTLGGESVFGTNNATLNISGICDSESAQLSADSKVLDFQVNLTLLCLANEPVLQK